MPNNAFADLDAIVSGTMLAEFGIRGIISPRIASQYGAAQPDPTRAQTEVRGIFSSGPAVDNIGGQSRGGAPGGATMIGGQTLVFWLAAATTRSLAYPIRRGDRVILPDEAAPNRFAVSAIRPTDMGDLELVMIEDEGT